MASPVFQGPTDLCAGAKLGEFTLKKRLSVGGMAEIWSATAASGPLALKILNESLAAGDMYRQMFRDEARLYDLLEHPCILKGLGYFEEGGRVFLGMELLDGRDLREVAASLAARGERLSVERLLQIAVDVARGLHYAHRAQDERGAPLDLVHRDVSPENVFLTRDSRVVLIDFGIARNRARDTMTNIDTRKGKPGYMSPEQLRMDLHITAASDVYSFGVLLWEQLAGARLFERPEDIHREIPSARSLRPEVPAALSDLIDTMLRPEPHRRPNMTLVASALQSIASMSSDPGPLGGWLSSLSASSSAAEVTAEIDIRGMGLSEG